MLALALCCVEFMTSKNIMFSAKFFFCDRMQRCNEKKARIVSKTILVSHCVALSLNTWLMQRNARSCVYCKRALKCERMAIKVLYVWKYNDVTYPTSGSLGTRRLVPGARITRWEFFFKCTPFILCYGDLLANKNPWHYLNTPASKRRLSINKHCSSK